MKAALKKRWVAALRSGKYKQCRDVLKDGNSYCCLGVLCVLTDRGGIGYDKLHKHGLDNDAQETLINLNDEKMYSFKRIAIWIEKNL